MKVFKFLLLAATAGFAVSCAQKADGVEEDPMAEQMTYTLNQENSSLEWKGKKTETYFHTGTVKFGDGMMKMKGEELEMGEFMIDMSTIKAEDKNLDQAKNTDLTTHLHGPDFFNVANFKDVKVKLGEYKDGKLQVMLNILGKDITTTIDADIKQSDDKAWITGKFDVDFKELNIMGMQPQEGENEYVQPIVTYDLKIEMDKQ